MDLIEASARQHEALVRHPWEQARLDLVRNVIASDVPLQPGDVVVDIGCGDTFVVEQLARAYPGVGFVAVDSAFTPDLLAMLTAKLTVPNVTLFSSLDQVTLARSAALVLLMDVIEHVPDDRTFVSDVCGRIWVDAQTRLLITVPAYQFLFSAHDRFLGHYRRYSAGTLTALLGTTGLRRLGVAYVFASLVPLRMLALLRERIAGADEATGLAGWNGSDATSRLLAAILSVDGRIGLALGRLGLRLPGLSLLALCRKSV
jgi:hypothetical protein